MYHVSKINKETLIPLIKHIMPGSKVYSDAWRAYSNLGQKGYEHFVVEHNHKFKHIYTNADTG